MARSLDGGLEVVDGDFTGGGGAEGAAGDDGKLEAGGAADVIDEGWAEAGDAGATAAADAGVDDAVRALAEEAGGEGLGGGVAGGDGIGKEERVACGGGGDGGDVPGGGGGGGGGAEIVHGTDDVGEVVVDGGDLGEGPVDLFELPGAMEGDLGEGGGGDPRRRTSSRGWRS